MSVRSAAVAIMGTVAAAALCASLVADGTVARPPTGSAHSGTTPSASRSTTRPSAGTAPTPAASTSSPVAALSEGAGWALTSSGLELTRDGGRAFTVVKPPLPAGTSVRSVAIDGTRITVGGSKASQAAVPDDEVSITSSEDGGRTWSPTFSVTSPSGTPPDAVQLVSRDGSVIGMSVTTFSPPSSWGVWFSTPDGGATWTEEGKLPSGGQVTDAGGVLWLVANPMNQTLFRSADDGKHWTAVKLPASIAGAALDLAGAFATGRVVLVAETSDPATGVPVEVLTTGDAGKTWTTLAHLLFTGGRGATDPMSASVVGNSVWIAGSGSAPQLVDSQGRVTATSAPRKGATVQAVSAATASSAWATVVEGSCPDGKSSCHDTWWLYRTSNGGVSWTPVPLAARVGRGADAASRSRGAASANGSTGGSAPSLPVEFSTEQGGLVGKSLKVDERSLSSTWVVPGVPLSAYEGSKLFPRQESWVWMGLTSAAPASEIRVGIDAFTTTSATSVHYSAFWSLGAATWKINTIDHLVGAGDVVRASISRPSPGAKWVVTIADVTQGWRFSHAVDYSGKEHVPLWLDEAPLLTTGAHRGDRAPFAPIKAVTFTRMKVNGAPLAASKFSYIEMVNTTTGQASVPRYTASRGSLTVRQTSADSVLRHNPL